MLQLDPGPFNEIDPAPVYFLYRHALELQLKAIALGDAGNLLAHKPDKISGHKSHSLSWLAQFVCQAVTAAGLQHEFKCPGIQDLADFRFFVRELAELDPGDYCFRLPVDPQQPTPMAPIIGEFADKMDALLELLDATQDALVATWLLKSDESCGPTIQ